MAHSHYWEQPREQQNWESVIKEAGNLIVPKTHWNISRDSSDYGFINIKMNYIGCFSSIDAKLISSKRQRHLIFVGLLAWIIANMSAGNRVYKHLDGSLTSFPHNIPENVKEIKIGYSQIPIIDYIEPFSSLEILNFFQNNLTRFPDLSNVSTVLRRLRLASNDIHEVKSIPPIIDLIYLDMSGNSLTDFPDIANLSSTLVELDLSLNHIRKINIHPVMSALEIINLDHNSLVEFPDLENVSGTLKELSIVENAFTKIDILVNLPKLSKLIIGGSRFSEFPDLCNLTSSLEELFLKKSMVDSVSYLPKMLKLKSLKLRKNQLSELPNIANLSLTLIALDVSYNQIVRISYVPKMKLLENVNFNGNLLTEFPDLSNIGTTLRRLEVANNNISYIPEERALSLKMLNYLDLSENPMVLLPSFCHLNNTLEMLLSEGHFTCDWRMVLIKTLDYFGKIIFSKESPHCSQPANLAMMNWNEITIKELISEAGEYYIYLFIKNQVIYPMFLLITQLSH